MNEKPIIHLCYRGVLGDDFQTHDDYLILDNYENKKFTAAELYKAGGRYIDSINEKITVSEITFLIPNSEVKPKNWNFAIWGAVRKYCIISFGYNNASKFNIGIPLALSSISIWKDGKSRIYTVRSDKKFIDSVLSSKIPLDN